MERRRGAHASGRFNDLGGGGTFELTAGPIPDPRTLRGYADLDKTLPSRIVAMAEAETFQYQDRQDAIVKNEADDGRRGQWMAFALMIILITLAAAFFLLDKPWGGVAFLSIPVIMVVRAFVLRK